METVVVGFAAGTNGNDDVFLQFDFQKISPFGNAFCEFPVFMTDFE